MKFPAAEIFLIIRQFLEQPEQFSFRLLEPAMAAIQELLVVVFEEGDQEAVHGLLVLELFLAPAVLLDLLIEGLNQVGGVEAPPDCGREVVEGEQVVIFRKCRYSVAPRYIGKEVEIELSDKEDQVQIYYNGELIRSHPLTTKQLNYHEEDYFQILKSDVMSHKEDDEIRAYTRESLKQYDLVEVADEE